MLEQPSKLDIAKAGLRSVGALIVHETKVHVGSVFNIAGKTAGVVVKSTVNVLPLSAGLISFAKDGLDAAIHRGRTEGVETMGMIGDNISSAASYVSTNVKSGYEKVVKSSSPAKEAEAT